MVRPGLTGDRPAGGEDLPEAIEKPRTHILYASFGCYLQWFISACLFCAPLQKLQGLKFFQTPPLGDPGS